MSVRIQEALSNCCQGVSQGVSIVAAHAGEWASSAVVHGANLAQKSAEFAKPHFVNLRNVVAKNKGPILFATASAAIGAILYAVLCSIFCKNTGLRALAPPEDSLKAFVSVFVNVASTATEIEDAFNKLNNADSDAIKHQLWVNQGSDPQAGDDWAGNFIRANATSVAIGNAINDVVASRRAAAISASNV